MTIFYTSTKSKTTRKQKAKQKAAWEKQQAQYGMPAKKARLVSEPWKPSVAPVGRVGADNFKQHKSLNSHAAVATKTEPQKYTGDKIIGIATMHKSNLVPIFNAEAAKEVANMRRGNDQ